MKTQVQNSKQSSQQGQQYSQQQDQQPYNQDEPAASSVRTTGS